MDHNVISAERYLIDQENAAEEACFTCAARNGHTITEAENCDDGDVGCQDCPFKSNKKENEWENLNLHDKKHGGNARREQT